MAANQPYASYGTAPVLSPIPLAGQKRPAKGGNGYEPNDAIFGLEKNKRRQQTQPNDGSGNINNDSNKPATIPTVLRGSIPEPPPTIENAPARAEAAELAALVALVAALVALVEALDADVDALEAEVLADEAELAAAL